MSLLNVLGTELKPCCFNPLTGYFRDGFCKTIEEDTGTHILCAVVDKEFLAFTKSKGNDLSTPIPYYNFPGLQPGDKWCLCISRWLQALKENKAPRLFLEACHKDALQYTTLEILKKYAFVE
ncbi:DUF2237 domain-containing protein [Aquimarina sp. ERC-38]|uniref:DUF2237 family protein n=1 Tax=Aquimarina sp. ERC-38 TaxID=2949996 RepID=UPI002245ADC6|nr:DUF2237 domain-containing protein [Aquimarina sp. ERC-38]UZO79826.1 DUF2237 domain-containing protein [Aquimarina sp. ERC-38]